MRWRARVRAGRGSAAVLGLVLVCALGVVAVMVGALGGAVADQRRVESAADLAALAGASAVQDGRAGCPAARVVARRDGAALEDCEASGAVVSVHAVRGTARVLGHRLQVTSWARAGPVGLEP